MAKSGHRARLGAGRSQVQILPFRLKNKRDEGELAPRLAWDQETAGSNPVIPIETARSFNGLGLRSDKAAMKVRFLPGLLTQRLAYGECRAWPEQILTGDLSCQRCID